MISILKRKKGLKVKILRQESLYWMKIFLVRSVLKSQISEFANPKKMLTFLSSEVRDQMARFRAL